MSTPLFDERGRDAHTYAPFRLENCLDTEWKDVRLVFDDWGWFQDAYGEDTIDGYYFNGYGVEGLIRALLFANGMDPEDPGIEYDSEGDSCYVHFNSMELALRVAELARAMIEDREALVRMIDVARTEGFED